MKFFKSSKKFSFFTAAAAVASLFTSLPSTEAVVYHADKIENGVILHAFSWSFNTIREKLPDIKKAGYTAVQTSPIQECLIGDSGNRFFGNWKYAYQPISQNIGNYIVGSEDEFKSLCTAAKQYGIKIIVDAVLNHMTVDLKNCASEWQDPRLYHNGKDIIYSDSRSLVTQGEIYGLKDIRTQDPQIQQKTLQLLKRIVADGASGFRFDTAKHIELPDDPVYGGQFWPVVLNNGAEFQYGEVLSDVDSRDEAYGYYMKITGSQYGYTIRDAVDANDFRVDRVMNYNARVSADKLITWVESHDTYGNDDKATVGLTNEKIKFAWAALAARKFTTPLFFSRPLGGGGSNPQFPGRSQLGDEGDPLYKDSDVAAVNLFRNAMVGEDEYLRNPYGDSKILMIERGRKGAVIINLNYSESYLNSDTRMADGEYENQTGNHGKFKVSGGKITGSLASRSITVLYENIPAGPEVGIQGFSSSSGDIPFKGDTLSITLLAQNANKATYSVNNQKEVSYSNGQSISIGESTSVGERVTVTLRAQGANNSSVKEVYTFLKKDPKAVITFYFEKPDSWGSSVNAYVYVESGSSVSKIAEWPGKAMSKVKGNTYSLTIDGDYDDALVIFNDGNKQSPSSNQPGFKIIDEGLYDSDGYRCQYGGVVTTTFKVYFEKPSSWGSSLNAYVYSQKGTVVSELARWPGKSMSGVSGNIYYVEVNSDYTGANIIFNDGKEQAPNSGSNGFEVKTNGLYTVNGFLKIYDNNSSSQAVIYYYSGWSKVNIHYQVGSGQWTQIPGVSMSSYSNGYWKIEIDIGSSSTSMNFVFNNGNDWDNNQGNNYSISGSGSYIVKNGHVSSGSV